MKQTTKIFALMAIGLSACNNNKKMNNTEMPEAPVANIIPHKMEIHGDVRIDNYYWMNQKDSPEVLAYLNAENEYLKKVMAPTEKFQEALYKEMRDRIQEKDESVPSLYNGYFYYSKYEEGKEHPIACRKKETLEAKEEIVVDYNLLAEGHEFFSPGGTSVSPDNKWTSVVYDITGRYLMEAYFKNLETGEMLNYSLPLYSGGVWAEDSKHFFYAKKDATTLRSFQIYRHELGKPGADVLVFEEKDAQYSCGIGKTRSKKYLTIGSGSTLTTEYLYLDASKPLEAFKVFSKRSKGILYDVDHANNQFYINTNWDALNFKLMTCSEANTDKAAWKPLIEHRADVLLEGFTLFKTHMVLQERKAGLNNIRIKALSGTEDYQLAFNDPTYMAYVSSNPEFESTKLRYFYTSLTTPSSTLDYDFTTKTTEVKKEQVVLGSFDKEDYTSERVFATAKDGTKVPISLVYKKGTKLDGSAPALLYGYGSYGASMDPYFSSTRLTMLDRGFVFALAHIRGGEEMGRQWYEDGKFLKKMNTFTDFIACADFLTENKYTSNDKLFAMGGSAGGLLMGAVANLAPEKFKGIVAQVPFVDVVTTMLDETIPLTTGEFEEWGNPKDSVYYFYMKSYSPYDNIEAKNYPNMLITTAYQDSQVQYWEPAKWVAKLRATKTDKNLLLFKCDMAASHGGKSGRFESLKDDALEFAFIFNLLGITK